MYTQAENHIQCITVLTVRRFQVGLALTSTAVSVSSAPTSPKGSSDLCRASLRRRCTAASPWAWRRGVRSASPRATSTTSSASGRTGVSAKASRGRRTPRRVRSTAGWTQTSHSSRRWEHTVIRQHRCSIGCVASLVRGDAIGHSFMIYSLFLESFIHICRCYFGDVNEHIML